MKTSGRSAKWQRSIYEQWEPRSHSSVFVFVFVFVSLTLPS